jgi:hypothetical protein
MHSVLTGSGDYHASYIMGTGNILPGDKGPGIEFYHLVLSESKVMKSGATPPSHNRFPWGGAYVITLLDAYWKNRVFVCRITLTWCVIEGSSTSSSLP